MMKDLRTTRIKVVQQATDLSAIGGLSSEFKSLTQSSLNTKYEMIPMVLPKVHRMINLKDIKFYYDFLKKTKPDIVQIRGAQIDGLNAQIAARLVPGIRILVCVHGMFSELVYLNPLKKYIHTHIIEPIIFNMCDGISCVYKKGNDRKQLAKFNKKLLPYVYNRMPDHMSSTLETTKDWRAKYSISEDAVVGVFCGRFSREKGLAYLADAFLEMKMTWPNQLHFLMVGDGDYLEEFKNRIENAGLAGFIHCVGAMSDVKPFLAGSDFFIMPSLHENHSISLLEALAADLPCIATDVGGNSEIVHDGIEGILCNPYSTDDLKNSIIRMLDENIRNNYKKNIVQNSYPQFSNKEVDKQLDRVYEILLEK